MSPTPEPHVSSEAHASSEAQASAEPRTAERYAGLVKAYDIRGIVPEEFDETAAYTIGATFAALTRADRIAVAHDMRGTSPALAAAFTEGVLSQGGHVLDAGLGSTDYLYYVSGSLDIPGAMFTASHNPAQYNGIKLCRAGAVPIGDGSGLERIRAGLVEGVPSCGRARGTVMKLGLLEQYAAHLRTLVDLAGSRPLKVVVDAGNGMAGLTVPQVLDHSRLDVVPLYFELDGTFPNHEADPMKPANVADLKARVLAEGADLGLAFDGDADRCFVVDERGEAVDPSQVIGLIAERELARHPGEAVVHNLITSRAVPEVIAEAGGTPIRSRVGHSFVKALMAEHGAVFGGEHSGHYYFRDFWFADTGMLAALHVLAALGEQDRPMSQLMARYRRYAASGEINVVVEHPATALTEVANAFSGDRAEIDRLDGLTVRLADGNWFNLRASNTEPVLRLNAEGPEASTVAELTDEVLACLKK
ncbi:phosphomannomutase/phosphoglucomutase [Streptomyces luteolus]|uniref:Phosphomannomutase/phosphoglucomutase n=1 Tax=Streptomyces luteolus TaxID=3043615 RepID=A0ABT6SSB6_9ACTN|nr:phosphomannomutase/phosphoglucomutase [Streptomyces sp. B-S-A12]MDI3418491.1 phosphomannomutase/phosphoglucomutase [Streptomyces sp. B-S-A12]